MTRFTNIYCQFRDFLYIRKIYKKILAKSICRQAPGYSDNVTAIETAIASLIASTKHGIYLHGQINKLKTVKPSSPIKQTGKGSRITLIRLMHNECIISEPLNADRAAADLITAGIAAIVESIHNLSLIVDDCIDEDAIRRGNPTVYAIGGVEGVLNATNRILNRIFCMLDEMPLSDHLKNTCASIIESEALKLCDAINSEVYWQTHAGEIPWDRLRKEDIVRVYEAKAAGISILGARLLDKCLPVNKEKASLIVSMVNRLGVYLQRVNDMENLSYIKSCGSHNIDRLSDISNRRVVLWNFNSAIVDQQDLCELRDEAYRSERDVPAINQYIDRLIRDGIIDAEVDALRRELIDILTEIDRHNYLSNNTKQLFKYVFKRYAEPLYIYRFRMAQ